MQSRLKRAAIEWIKIAASLPHWRRCARLYNLDAGEFSDLQYEWFQVQYEHAVRHVPHYRRNPAYPVDLFQISPHLEGALSRLPILSKGEVKSNPQRFYSSHWSPSWVHTTGGTTGAPLRVRAGLFERGFTEAILGERYRRLVGSRRPRVLRLSGYIDGAEPGVMWQQIAGSRVAYLSIYQLSADKREELSSLIEDFRPRILHGYASALVQLAGALAPGDPSCDGQVWISTSETLTEQQRTFIETRLNVRVLNEYGSQEGQHLVLECLAGGLHVHPLRGVVEILDLERDEPVPPGEQGRVVVTGLISRHMPLIRYDLGDTAVRVANGPCPCGLGWPRIGTIAGRTEDLVRTADGRRIGLLSHSTTKDLVGVRESQIVQRGFGDFLYRVVPEAQLEIASFEAHVRGELTRRIGQEVRVQFEYHADAIPRTDSGKLRAVVVDF